MKAESYTKLNDTDYIFHYKISDLREYIRVGRSGEPQYPIIMSTKDNMCIYRHFVTMFSGEIVLLTFKIQHDPFFNSPFNPDVYLKSYQPEKETKYSESYTYEIVDLSQLQKPNKLKAKNNGN